MAPIMQAVAQMPNATTQAVSCAVPPNQSRDRPNSNVPMNPPAKPMHEYTATVAPRSRGSATASRPEVRLEKLPCTTKPAAMRSPALITGTRPWRWYVGQGVMTARCRTGPLARPTSRPTRRLSACSILASHHPLGAPRRTQGTPRSIVAARQSPRSSPCNRWSAPTRRDYRARRGSLASCEVVRRGSRRACVVARPRRAAGQLRRARHSL